MGGRSTLVCALVAVLVPTLVACGGERGTTVRIDGSSTVAPLSEAAAELFRHERPRINITVGTAGTGGGLERFCNGEIDIADASREIKDDEARTCEANGISFAEVRIGNDGLAVAINPENDWADCLTVEQLRTMWDEGSDVDNWRDVDPSFPDRPLLLYGPGTDSGTFDYFTEAVNGEAGRQRTRYNNIGEDDNAGLRGVQGDLGALFYVGLSYIEENRDSLKPARVENPDTGDCVEPTARTVQSGEYSPLGRPLYIYPSDTALARPEVTDFIDFYVENQARIAEAARFVPLNEEQEQEAREAIQRLTETTETGTGTE